jgi:aldehyde:ferredoxin oxidoreductase
MSRGGYTGKLLWVDLTAGLTEVKPLNQEYINEYLGGSGIGARLLLDLAGGEFGRLEPLSPHNPLIFMAGPLVGSGLPATGRLSACARSPLTGIYAESSVGGFLGAALKYAGLDGIVITGAAAAPCYLKITSGKVLLLPADYLWGRDTYETSDLLMAEMAGERGLKATACIGPAGENLVPFACVASNKGHFLGRTGMGAVMGAKKLKGLVIAGNTAPPVFDREAVRALKKEITGKMKENLVLQSLHVYGTNSAIDMALFTGDVPIKNWTVGEWDEGINKINGPAFDAVLTGRKTCHACPVICKREVEVKDGPFRTEQGPGPEYETVASFGTMCLIDSVEALCRLNDICNRLGLDTITVGATAAFLLEAAETGLLPDNSAGLSFGNAEAVMELVSKAAYRQGMGSLLSAGSRELSRRLGPESIPLLTTVKGLEAPMHDPRAGHGMGLAYATGYRGACHMSDLTMGIEQGSALFPGLGLEEYYEGQTSQGKAEMVAIAQDFGGIVGGAAIFCLLGVMGYSDSDIVRALQAVTGENHTQDSLLSQGRRIWYLKRVLNNLCGIRKEDDRLPERLLQSLDSGGAAASVPDMELMLGEYYVLRDLSPRGLPGAETLRKLGLGFAVPWLYPD